LEYPAHELPNCISFGGELVFVGTSIMNEEIQEHSPQKGNIYAYQFAGELQQMHVWPQNGAIYDMVTFTDDEKLYLAAGVNAMVKVYQVG